MEQDSEPQPSNLAAAATGDFAAPLPDDHLPGLEDQSDRAGMSSIGSSVTAPVFDPAGPLGADRCDKFNKKHATY